MLASHGGRWSIGELAERAGATVKTVRFYSDHGLLPSSRSAGGHRRYGPDALERLGLIRSLRALELPVTEVRRVLEAEDDWDGAIEDAVAGQLHELGSRLRALRWREAGLRLVMECPPQQRAERLRLIGAVTAAPSTDPLVRFWRSWLPVRMPARALESFLHRAVPQTPDDPTPPQVLAFAQLNAFVSRPCGSRSDRGQPAAHRFTHGFRPAVLYDGLGQAYDLAAAQLRQGLAPHSGEALSCFVAAYADSQGAHDTAGFRRLLARRLVKDPRLDRYWELVAEMIGPRDGQPALTPGATHDWLLTALTDETGNHEAPSVGHGPRS